MTANRRSARREEIVDADIIDIVDAKLINPAEPAADAAPRDVTPAEPVLWHIVLFGIAATFVCTVLATLLIGDLGMALTLSATLLAAFAVRAFLAYED